METTVSSQPQEPPILSVPPTPVDGRNPWKYLTIGLIIVLIILVGYFIWIRITFHNDLVPIIIPTTVPSGTITYTPTIVTPSQGFSKIPYSVSQKAQQIQTAYDRGVRDFDQFTDSITVTRDGMLNLQIYSKDPINSQNEAELKTITAYYLVDISSLHVREADIWIPYNRLKELGDLKWLSNIKPTSPGPRP